MASEHSSFFNECVPTEERLTRLRDGWINRHSLHWRLSRREPFNIVVLEEGKLVMKSSRDLVELAREEELEVLFNQVLYSWPRLFCLPTFVRGVAQYEWEAGAFDDGTILLCRKATKNESQPIESPFQSDTPIYFDPDDSMLWQIMPKADNSVITIRTIALLESLFAPVCDFHSSWGISSWIPMQMTTPVLSSVGRFGAGDWLSVHVNLRACVPDQEGYRSKHFERAWGTSPKTVGLPLNRQTAHVPAISRGKNATAIEYLISVSMVLRKTEAKKAASAMKYDIFVWVDYDTRFDDPRTQESIFPVLSSQIDVNLGLKDCGAGGEAIFQYLAVLARSIDHWKDCWDNMMNEVNNNINIQLQDTLSEKRWNSLLFDDSLQLLEQYHTVLQLLRIWGNWIEETERCIENLGRELIQQCESWQAWQEEYARRDLDQWPLNMTNLRHNVKCLQDFFRTRALPVQERIRMKKDEVASLQDALLSTSSLRETLKAKTLNLYIGVFTTITVFFTPLGFIAVNYPVICFVEDWSSPDTSTTHSDKIIVGEVCARVKLTVGDQTRPRHLLGTYQLVSRTSLGCWTTIDCFGVHHAPGSKAEASTVDDMAPRLGKLARAVNDKNRIDWMRWLFARPLQLSLKAGPQERHGAPGMRHSEMSGRG
ncbi:hypothetical protein NUW58_g1265 [Xylaria curta]|uniref:Uncharacterized protein n=1 Tax=Xylaria curta TaxID=42375 RepID=A0ACC1PMS2_9PEZI|nr:hypothetical protein NUW58_g1265 [Xylaria curta]